MNRMQLLFQMLNILGNNYNDLDINDKVNLLGAAGDDPSAWAFGINNPEAVGASAANMYNKSKLLNDSISSLAESPGATPELMDDIVDTGFNIGFNFDSNAPKTIPNNATQRMLRAPKQTLRDMFAQYSSLATNPGKYLS